MKYSEDDGRTAPRISWLAAVSRLLAAAFGLLLGWLLLELLVRLAFPTLPYMLQAPLRYVKKAPWSGETLLPPAAWRAEDNFQMVMVPDLVDSLQFPNVNVSFHLTTKNWLDPNSVVGFRVDRPEWEPRWPVDLVVVGDSFAMCFTEYADCWVPLLEQDGGLSAVNLAQGATGSISHHNIARTFGLPYEPKLVLWQWYGNDFNEDYGFVNRHRQKAAMADPEPGPVERWLQANSVVYWLWRTVTASHPNLAGYEVQVDPYYVRSGEVELTFGRPYILQAGDMTLEKNQEGLRHTLKALDETRAFLAERGIPLAVVLMPFKEEVYADLTRPQLGDSVLQGLGQGRREMLAWCAANQVPCLDVTEGLTAAAAAGGQLFFVRDTHLSEAGNAVVADLVLAFLREQQLPR